MARAESPVNRVYIAGQAALLEDGKAIYGIPGPGTYAAPSSFSNQAAHDYDAGRQIFATPPAWTLKGRIHDSEIAKSPGPVYDANRGYRYLEQHGVQRHPDSEGTFGAGTRDQPHRFYSPQHSQATLLCTGSPGPAAYTQKEGRRISHTLGDAPTWQFGTRLKGPWDRPSNFSPGPVYRTEATLGPGGAPVYRKAPRFSFGPAGMRRRGMQQSRNEALKVLWSREQRKEEGRNAPGPGYYKAESASRALSRQAVAYSFSAALTGREDIETEMTELSEIHLPSTFKSPCTRFGPPSGPARAHSVPLLDQGRSGTPDYHTQLAMSAEAARQSRNPGPAEYDVLPHVQALSSHPRAPAPGFGSEARQCNKTVGSGLSLPGPGTYKAEEGLDNTSRHPMAPAFSLAAPWQPPRPTSARPGPGAYRVLTDGELERSVSQHANLGSASFSKGKPTSRHTFIPKSDSPGPIYDIRTTLGRRKAPAPAFGDKSAPAAAAHTQTVPDFFTGALGTLGQDSPGPNINIPQGKPSRLGPGTPWGNWKHGVKLPPRIPASLSMSRESSLDSKEASPGPCYNPPLSLVNSKHTHGGSFSFGVGGRAPLYTVKF
ncbi:hypothetical protein WJX77_002540 [Trebouxia sp. C0004]